ncbi:hypothetical protein [Micromonospora sediminicola]|uniref:hypothetical protein n=1 Tax=Micromonospora sediminicola TaxID=946078 RepID=UPI003797C21B
MSYEHRRRTPTEPAASLNERILSHLRHMPQTRPELLHHVPEVPDWRCRDCAQPWPCPTSRDRLRQQHHHTPVPVFQYLGACYVQAMADLARTADAGLHARFLGWLPRRAPLNRTPDHRFTQRRTDA